MRIRLRCSWRTGLSPIYPPFLLLVSGCYEDTVTTERNAVLTADGTRFSCDRERGTRADVVDLLPALSSTGPGSITSSPERPV